MGPLPDLFFVMNLFWSGLTESVPRICPGQGKTVAGNGKMRYTDTYVEKGLPERCRNPERRKRKQR